MSARQAIISAFRSTHDTVGFSFLYAKVSYTKHGIRARVYELVKEGTIIKLAINVYMLVDRQNYHLQILGDANDIAPRLIQGGFRADGLFLDVPFRSGGQLGGGKNLAPFPVMDRKELVTAMMNAKKLLRTPNSPLVFVFTDGRSTKGLREYLLGFLGKILRKVDSFTYEKTYANGATCIIGRYELPRERFYVFTKSGEVDFDTAALVNYRAVRPSAYATMKNIPVLADMLRKIGREGDIWVDMFAGSGAFYHAAKEVNISTVNIDIATEPIPYLLGK
jgi:hypothetical protein